MKIGIVCYPTYGGSGVVATELGKALAGYGHEVHFISYAVPMRLDGFSGNVFFHEVEMTNYPLFEFPLYTSALASKIVEVTKFEKLDLLACTIGSSNSALPSTMPPWGPGKVLCVDAVMTPAPAASGSWKARPPISPRTIAAS